MNEEPVRSFSNSESISTPSRQEILREYEINIKFHSRGCVIRVGCKSIPFSNTDEAIAELEKYFKNPYEISKEWGEILV
jgi:hypothetical protein